MVLRLLRMILTPLAVYVLFRRVHRFILGNSVLQVTKRDVGMCQSKRRLLKMMTANSGVCCGDPHR